MQHILVLDLSLVIRERRSEAPLRYLQHIQMPWSVKDSRFIRGYTLYEPNDCRLNACDPSIRTDDRAAQELSLVKDGW